MKQLSLAGLVGLLVLSSGCAGFAFGSKPTGVGGLYANTQMSEAVTQNKLGSKTGEACASSILGLVTTGDASVASAAKAGGISAIGSVDNSYSNILGIYSTYCVQVSGD